MTFSAEVRRELESVETKNECCVFAEKIGRLANSIKRITDSDKIPIEIIKSKCCKKAFLRGVFLSAGTISNPEKAYHLEIVVSDFEIAENIKKNMSSLGINGKITERKNHEVIYIKEAEQIIDFLNVIGAHGCLLEFENVRLVKELRNKANRIVNCETANVDRTLDAAEKEIIAINKIKEKKTLDYLSLKLKEVAVARINNPEASLSELAEIIGDVSRSGLNHRLKRIEEIARKI